MIPFNLKQCLHTIKTECPSSYGLEDCCDSTTCEESCIFCWEQAIENIDDMEDDPMSHITPRIVKGP